MFPVLMAFPQAGAYHGSSLGIDKIVLNVEHVNSRLHSDMAVAEESSCGFEKAAQPAFDSPS